VIPLGLNMRGLDAFDRSREHLKLRDKLSRSTEGLRHKEGEDEMAMRIEDGETRVG